MIDESKITTLIDIYKWKNPIEIGVEKIIPQAAVVFITHTRPDNIYFGRWSGEPYYFFEKYGQALVTDFKEQENKIYYPEKVKLFSYIIVPGFIENFIEKDNEPRENNV